MNEGITEKIINLTSLQRNIFLDVCAGKSLEEMVSRFSLGDDLLVNQIGNIYIKLGLVDLPQSLRKKLIEKDYCSALHELKSTQSQIFDINPGNDVYAESIPASVMDIVRMDLSAVWEYLKEHPGETIESYEVITQQEERKQQILRRIMIVVFSALLILNLIYIYFWADSSLTGQ